MMMVMTMVLLTMSEREIHVTYINMSFGQPGWWSSAKRVKELAVDDNKRHR